MTEMDRRTFITGLGAAVAVAPGFSLRTLQHRGRPPGADDRQSRIPRAAAASPRLARRQGLEGRTDPRRQSELEKLSELLEQNCGNPVSLTCCDTRSPTRAGTRRNGRTTRLVARRGRKKTEVASYGATRCDG